MAEGHLEEATWLLASLEGASGDLELRLETGEPAGRIEVRSGRITGASTVVATLGLCDLVAEKLSISVERIGKILGTDAHDDVACLERLRATTLVEPGEVRRLHLRWITSSVSTLARLSASGRIHSRELTQRSGSGSGEGYSLLECSLEIAGMSGTAPRPPSGYARVATLADRAFCVALDGGSPVPLHVSGPPDSWTLAELLLVTDRLLGSPSGARTPTISVVASPGPGTAVWKTRGRLSVFGFPDRASLRTSVAELYSRFLHESGESVS